MTNHPSNVYNKWLHAHPGLATPTFVVSHADPGSATLTWSEALPPGVIKIYLANYLVLFESKVAQISGFSAPCHAPKVWGGGPTPLCPNRGPLLPSCEGFRSIASKLWPCIMNKQTDRQTHRQIKTYYFIYKINLKLSMAVWVRLYVSLSSLVSGDQNLKIMNKFCHAATLTV